MPCWLCWYQIILRRLKATCSNVLARTIFTIWCAMNILEAEGPWFGNFIYNALLVYICEVMIDIIKHSFIAKFNETKPIVFSEFLEQLCKQTLNIGSEDGKKNLTFVPLAPACVVIRVLTPVYAAHLPYFPFPWRLFWILLLSAVSYIMLASLKVDSKYGIGEVQAHPWIVAAAEMFMRWKFNARMYAAILGFPLANIPPHARQCT
ncbi:hypothetical protein NE237_021717 [Protea cynaroides]|uniref:Uncharacterized protein n=1 Tax=Protea cynaroides TaxID=273540 RepID=A0A9Q0H8H0_9MAGN|nr:hypothetical protein NE237_021717 [Protea cynaroides]